jgi:hypothetical protein
MRSTTALRARPRRGLPPERHLRVPEGLSTTGNDHYLDHHGDNGEHHDEHNDHPPGEHNDHAPGEQHLLLHL